MVKVLDFGLAAVLQGPAATADPANSPTLTMLGATEVGMIMGTAAYMSPEQASGKPVDKRADIWSFGVVLFEMLTGQRLFDGGETVSHILADVLRAPIDFGRLPVETPAVIRDLLRRCLDRDVRNRLRDIGEARVVTGKYLADPSSGAQAPPPQATSLRYGIVAVAMGLIAAVAGFGWWYATPRAVERPLVQLDVDLGPEVSLGSRGRRRRHYFSRWRQAGIRVEVAAVYPPPESAQGHRVGRNGRSLCSFLLSGRAVGCIFRRRKARKRFRWKAARRSPCATLPFRARRRLGRGPQHHRGAHSPVFCRGFPTPAARPSR